LDIRGRARLAVRRWGVKIIFVDYLQLVSHGGAKSRENEVGFVSRGLKAMAMELGIPVVAAAQLNRQAENRPDNRPKLSDLRESGSRTPISLRSFTALPTTRSPTRNRSLRTRS
jgi:replicative DNA helicase